MDVRYPGFIADCSINRIPKMNGLILERKYSKKASDNPGLFLGSLLPGLN
ncbi:MAG: hypothetical protein K1X82_00235 [Bacteroidia bacterium]|nr:hypothetical protein [Bacteroidia bacterium]